MSKYWSQVVQGIEPYVPGEQPQVEGLIKLNTNESPYPPSPRVAQAITENVINRLRYYPDPNALKLRESIASYYGVDVQSVFAGNSSDEVLAQTFMAFFQQPEPILYPDITYGFYPVYCQLFGIEANLIPLAEDFSVDFSAYQRPNGGIIFPNPNAPTGLLSTLEQIEALLQNNPQSVVVVDEAYIDFGGESAVPLTERYDNLLVVQTFSKSRALAGLRVGFAIGHPQLIEGLERVKNSFNSYPLDAIAQAAATAAMDDVPYFKECRDKVIATRERVAKALLEKDFTVLPSKANFVMVKPPGSLCAADLAAHLREKKVLVRYFAKARISDYLRISIGSDQEMDALLQALTELGL
ncbi:histidinol-phosphate transaminase [Gilvimarinus sp. DA14]|uniref:histidinol-phosphate transaminase n=1 Tax=Gilvimarinus sp. DA14 TaxID=2956798 RepID=UPI0020B86B2A|nr:histidinol-phosphate transaminase [Gilvimarinus sp. DA14]UTF59808.1 histidinol-phosphate transaminase [Gilvimarinus sp. DA14]